MALNHARLPIPPHPRLHVRQSRRNGSVVKASVSPPAERSRIAIYATINRVW
jgi:hypothetical protein